MQLTQRSRLQRYGFAAAVTASAIVLHSVLDLFIAGHTIFLFAYPAVVLSAWYGGLGAGLFSTALGAAHVFSLVSQRALAAEDPIALRVLGFLVSGVLIGLVSESLHRTSARARAAAEERGRTERSLKDAQALAHMGSWEVSLPDLERLAHNAMRWSDETYRIFGLAPQSVPVTAETFLSAVHPDDREEVQRAVLAAMRSGDRYEMEHRIVRPDGSVRTVHEYGTVVRDERGRPLRVIGTCHDVTEQRAAERELRRREAQLRLIIDSAPVLIAYLDEDLRYERANATYRAWFGLDPDTQVVGRTVREVLGDSSWVTVEPYLRRALSGEEVSYEREVTYRQGARWVQASYVPDRDEHGQVRGVVAVVHDMSEQKRTELALRASEEALRRVSEDRKRLHAAERAARARAEAASRAKDDFLAVLSHELRTPLTPVLTGAQMLEADPRANPHARKFASLIRRNAELEARLIDDLLDLTRVSRGKLSLHIGDVDAHEGLREVVKMCASDIQQKRLEVHFELAASHFRVRADDGRFKQVLWNLLKNAIKFSEPDRIITLRTRDDDSARLRIEVSDQGMGIDPGLLPKLFQAFEQGGTSTTDRFGGLGLGLSLSKALVDAMGGTITAHSEGVGRGATFALTLPCSREPMLAHARADVAPVPAARERTPARVLLVEDHEDTALLMAEFLRLRGYDVTCAGSVEDARTAAEHARFDVVLSDLGLPDGSGIDLMRELGPRHGVRGIALSGYGMDKDVQEAKRAGFSDHLVKPVNLEHLLHVLSRTLERPALH